jgi:hypothetical protein
MLHTIFVTPHERPLHPRHTALAAAAAVGHAAVAEALLTGHAARPAGRPALELGAAEDDGTVPRLLEQFGAA